MKTRCRSLSEPYHSGLSRMLIVIAWKTLPVSAVIEMTAVLLFAWNMMMTLTTGSPLEMFLEARQKRELAAQS